ncbi:hypothetical protein M408DRAFT_331777 [Serendipita vermifera MAFF 305830]|uniref:Uncharacterized protein n=1 Tax=Serendipita vermifera MAFF 305830 TaxID=933852 RepID=A0A0C3AWM8_SERVB|nr:hypothetical protein M408DRAFT_331777 [Serendipita vermifera MAFF 305830]
MAPTVWVIKAKTDCEQESDYHVGAFGVDQPPDTFPIINLPLLDLHFDVSSLSKLSPSASISPLFFPSTILAIHRTYVHYGAPYPIT